MLQTLFILRNKSTETSRSKGKGFHVVNNGLAVARNSVSINFPFKVHCDVIVTDLISSNTRAFAAGALVSNKHVFYVLVDIKIRVCRGAL